MTDGAFGWRRPHGPRFWMRLNTLIQNKLDRSLIGRGFAIAQVCAGDGAAGEYAMDTQ